jgi:hypothetical protein
VSRTRCDDFYSINENTLYRGPDGLHIHTTQYRFLCHSVWFYDFPVSGGFTGFAAIATVTTATLLITLLYAMVSHMIYCAAA